MYLVCVVRGIRIVGDLEVGVELYITRLELPPGSGDSGRAMAVSAVYQSCVS